MSATLHVRLDQEAERKIDAFQAKNGIENRSQAIRMLLALALREAGEAADAAWTAQAFKEGLIVGQTRLKKRIQEAVDTALSEFDS